MSSIRHRMPSTAARLQSDLHSITERLADLIRELPVKRFETGGMVVLLAPDYYWGEATAEQRNTQLAIKRDYEKWFEILRSVFRTPADHLNQKIQEADVEFRKWIELGLNRSIDSDREVTEKRLRDDAERFLKLLKILTAGPVSEIILIPDTNAIVGEPDPTQYKDIAGDDSFVFLLLPTVLAELDELKNNHRKNPDFRKKVNKVITRIKGWCSQGKILDGITVNKTITVRATASEPDMKCTLTWLDEHNRDDRIIATVLEIQSDHPAARVVLITGDVNLSNKADAARIEWVDNG